MSSRNNQEQCWMCTFPYTPFRSGLRTHAATRMPWVAGCNREEQWVVPEQLARVLGRRETALHKRPTQVRRQLEDKPHLCKGDSFCSGREDSRALQLHQCCNCNFIAVSETASSNSRALAECSCEDSSEYSCNITGNSNVNPFPPPRISLSHKALSYRHIYIFMLFNTPLFIRLIACTYLAGNKTSDFMHLVCSLKSSAQKGKYALLSYRD